MLAKVLNNRIFILCAAALAFCAALVVVPQIALAEEAPYTVRSVSINATLDESGDLTVVEQRTLNFTSAVDSVSFSLDSSYFGAMGIESISEKSGKEIYDYVAVPENEENKYDPNTYVLITTDNANTVRIFMDKNEGDTAKLTLKYSLVGLGKRWADTGDMLWQFLPSTWQAKTKNIDLTLTLPVESGKSIKVDDNVFVWTHGASNVDITQAEEEANALNFTCASIAAGEYIEVRVLFPAEWLSNVPETDVEKRDQILAEEKDLAQQAEKDKPVDSTLFWVFFVISLVITVGCLAASAALFIRRKNMGKGAQLSSYLRELPSEDHPAVLDAIRNKGIADTRGITAALLMLATYGIIEIRKGRVEICNSRAGRRTSDYAFMRNREREYMLSGKFESLFMRMLFHDIAGDKDILYISQIEEFARLHPYEFSQLIVEWKSSVEEEAKRITFDESNGKKKMLVVFIMAAVTAVVSIVCTIITHSILLVILGLVAAAGMCAMALIVRRDAPATCNLMLRCEANYTWLLEFSSLGEDLPYSKQEWNAFIVMATAYGIESSVLNQLVNLRPELLHDPEMGIAFSFFATTEGTPSCAATFEKALEAGISYASREGYATITTKRKGLSIMRDNEGKMYKHHGRRSRSSKRHAVNKRPSRGITRRQ